MARVNTITALQLVTLSGKPIVTADNERSTPVIHGGADPLSDSKAGFFQIGISGGINQSNLGTLWRSAYVYGAAQIFTVGARYKPQSTDTAKTWRHIPLVEYQSIDDLVLHLPRSCPLIGVEIDPGATSILEFVHPSRACYLLGAEDRGLTGAERQRCHQLVQLPGNYSLNVAAAGTALMHDRCMQLHNA